MSKHIPGPSAYDQHLRIIELDGDFRRNPKTSHYCCKCQKDIDPSKPYRMVHLVDGGAWVLHPEEEARYVPNGGDVGGHPIGPDCSKRLGIEWTQGAYGPKPIAKAEGRS